MHARDLMTTDPAVVQTEDTLAEAARLMRIRDVGLLPVVDTLASRRLVGVITDRDIVVRAVAFEHGSAAKVREHMSRDPLVIVTPAATAEDVVEQMRVHQVRRLPVVDQAGMVLGIIALADLANILGDGDHDLVERAIAGVSKPGALVAGN